MPSSFQMGTTGKLKTEKSRQELKSHNKNVTKMKQYLKQQMEEAFEKTVRDTFNNNPMKGTPFEGMIIYSAIGTTAGSFKDSLKADKVKIGLTEKEIDELVDEVSTKIINKYLEL